MGEEVEEAEKLRDPSHVRNYGEDEWRAFVEAAGLEVEEFRFFEQADRAAAVARPLRLRGRRGASAWWSCSATASEGATSTLDKIAVRAGPV